MQVIYTYIYILKKPLEATKNMQDIEIKVYNLLLIFKHVSILFLSI
jgi:hypothetical protein